MQPPFSTSPNPRDFRLPERDLLNPGKFLEGQIVISLHLPLYILPPPPSYSPSIFWVYTEEAFSLILPSPPSPLDRKALYQIP
ncbi:hypothetical protein L6164_006412 [Bauhinia variegata]|uniref:Uncharacterized protein n=1 Tax=Bauhinia variegata TaxID=167791 RepID=A0ACB9PUG0_BAUVA|nr:hypothetical protein L6164_006412 [Bauhinia variegata]